jgi:hypothetical protein
MPNNGGGGFGAIERTVTSWGRNELEVSLRYFDKKFANPYARPITYADEYEGQRARNEAGVRARWRGKPNEDWVLRAEADLSMWPYDNTPEISPPPLSNNTAGLTNLQTYARADFLGLRFLKLAGWAQYKNKDLRHGGFGTCFETYAGGNLPVDGTGTPILVDANGNPIDQGCTGQFIRVAGRGWVDIVPRLFGIAIQYQHEWLDDPKYPTSFRQDRLVWAEVFATPIKDVRLRWKTRLLDEAIDRPDYGETTLWSFVEASWFYSRLFTAELRYDFIKFLDQRASTLAVQPNPVHRVRLEIITNF